MVLCEDIGPQVSPNLHMEENGRPCDLLIARMVRLAPSRPAWRSFKHQSNRCHYCHGAAIHGSESGIYVEPSNYWRIPQACVPCQHYAGTLLHYCRDHCYLSAIYQYYAGAPATKQLLQKAPTMNLRGSKLEGGTNLITGNSVRTARTVEFSGDTR